MELLTLALARMPLGAADFFSWVATTTAKTDIAIKAVITTVSIGFVGFMVFKNGFTIPKVLGAGAVAAVIWWLVMMNGIVTIAGWFDTFTKGGGA